MALKCPACLETLTKNSLHPVSGIEQDLALKCFLFGDLRVEEPLLNNFARPFEFKFVKFLEILNKVK